MDWVALVTAYGLVAWWMFVRTPRTPVPERV